jgi:hypothetical protein
MDLLARKFIPMLLEEKRKAHVFFGAFTLSHFKEDAYSI